MNLKQLTIDNRQLKMKSRTGFTLVELILAMGILSMLMTVIMRVFIQIIEMKLEAEAESSTSQDSRYIFSRLAYDVNRATSITLPANPGDSGDTLTLVIDGVNYSYSLDASGNLLVDNGAGTNALNSSGSKVTATGPTSPLFTHLGGTTDAQSVKIDLNVESLTIRVNGPVVRTLSTTVGTR